MQILFDARVLGEHMHGIARYCFNLLRRILDNPGENGFTVLISRPEVKEWFRPSPAVRFLPAPIPLYSIQEQIGLPLLLRQERFDLYHSPTYTLPYAFSARGIITIHDLIHLLFPRDYGLKHRFYYSLLVRPIVRRCLKVLTVSEHSKLDIQRLLKGDPQKIAVVPNGLEPQWRPGLPDQDFLTRHDLSSRYLLFVGNPRPHKNFPRVLSAFAELVQKDGYPGKLAAVGLGPVDVPGDLKSRIVFFPSCRDPELAWLYAGADLLAAPSLYEGFGLPVLEAMACGCPVLIGDCGALPEVVGDAGVRVDPYKDEAILGGLRSLLFNPELRAALKERGPKQAARFSWEESAGKVRKIYDDLRREITAR
jgi:glycosyltransferase involved in cell wall biosynthesis